jgi:hypothetical protein
VSAYWLCDERGRVGDLLVNTYRFSGLTVWKSTDAVIEPVSISLLRAPHVKRAGRRLPLVLGGFAVGWKDDDDTALFHSRIALVKLDLGSTAIRTYADFSAILGHKEVADRRDALLRSLAVQNDLYHEFLMLPDLAMSPTDAGDALAALEHSLVFVE